MKKRSSGILMHITSLPSPFGIGDMGDGAYRFVDFLEQSKQKSWQVLPFNPTSGINGHSPYSSMSAFGANILLISPELMLKDGLLSEKDVDTCLDSNGVVDYPKVLEFKNRLFNIAFKKFQTIEDKQGYTDFCAENAYWLEDFAMFIAFKEYFQDKLWSEWPQDIRDRNQQAVINLKAQMNGKIEKEKFLQYLFFKQWFALKKYANQKGVEIIGDIPIYVTYDSVDVWQDPSVFKLNAEKELKYLAGVPPDYFSKTGQLWGNPVYDWDALAKDKYAWWIKRIEHNLKLFDWVRIDHFRGFVDYWQVPLGEKTAIGGEWQKAPAFDFFETILQRFPDAPIIAEDLGIITDEVREAIKHFGFPGMKILIFAFYEDKKDHPYLPDNYIDNCVAYTGTHDNNTVKGWFENETQEADKKRLFKCLGREVSVDELPWAMIKLLMESKANMALFPMQDILGLKQEDRMNLPGTLDGNWQWRLKPEQLTPQITAQLAEITLSTSR
ncbi:MAG: 4-alpha-glucanotransferase [PVC group bacterium]|nr:4-alpha-glucanotransferase [PVC group bacterium]